MRWIAALLAAGLAGGCEHVFEPFQRNDVATFSMFGQLDLSADTQWVRVMPVRQQLLPGPEGIDAVVTMEHLASGRVVTLRDSLFRYEDEDLGGVAYAHNYWTTERLEPGAEYRVTATRSDGASTTARVVVPEEIELIFRADVRNALGSAATLQVRAEQVVFVEVLHLMQSTEGNREMVWIALREDRRFATDDPTLHGFRIDGFPYFADELAEMDRHEIRVTTARADWPFHAELTDLEISLPGGVPSNVEGGLGFVGGVATRTIPYARCQMLAVGAVPGSECDVEHDARAASLAGRVIGPACGVPNLPLREIRLVERFAGGGAISRRWRVGPAGEYRFEGIEPGAALSLEVVGAAPVQLPPLAPGQRYAVPDLSAPAAC